MAVNAKLLKSVLVIISLFFGVALQDEATSSASSTSSPSNDGEGRQGLDVDLSDLIIIVITQPNKFHVKRATLFSDLLQEQVKTANLGKPILYLTHEKWPRLNGAWTLQPLMSRVASEHGDSSWVIFCEEETRIDLKGLLRVLGRYDSRHPQFLGKGLQDEEAVVIHHYAFHENPGSFVYPDFAAGVILSLPLVKSLAKRLEDKRGDFSIDAQHELAMLIWDQDKGQRMTDIPELCTNSRDKQCVTTNNIPFPDCGPPVPEDDIFIAVKTCEQNHKDRIPIIQSLWSKKAKHIEYYSETQDAGIPTIDLGVPNTERGHCGKTYAILKRAAENPNISKRPWLLITDDDTLISIPRLRRLLACYDHSEPTILGERYGYNVIQYGYNYLTGGGGMVFSQPALRALVESNMCSCPSNDSPDDMVLIGLCPQRLGISLTHSPLFHQARPEDYPKAMLNRQTPVSFHRFWNNDPKQVFKTWLSANISEEGNHDEL